MDAIGIATSARREYRTAECVASQISTELERRLGPSELDLEDGAGVGRGFEVVKVEVLPALGAVPTA
jgi:hypothetical protein